MYEYIKSRVERAISAFKKGRFAIILDDDIRENEGDLVLSGNLVNTDSINFMLKKDNWNNMFGGLERSSRQSRFGPNGSTQR